MAQSLGQDVPHTRRAVRQLFQGRWETVLHPGNVYDALRELLQFPETATRAAELKEVGLQIGWEPGQPMTFEQSLQMLRAGKQVTVDFSAAGWFGRVANQIIPFYNAAVQGPRALARAWRRNPGLVAWKLGTLTASSLTLWWTFKDEPWWREKSAKDKFAYWHFPFERDGKTELLKIPRNQEIGAIVGMTEALADAFYREDPAKFQAAFGATLEGLNPFSLPPLVGEAAEQLANRDFWSETPIVPRGQAEMPPEEQVGPYTSRAAIALGETFGVSPRRIDHAIRGLGGPVASDLFELLGVGKPGGKREGEMADIPVAGRLFARGGAMGTHPLSIEALYDALDQALQRQQSKKTPETSQERLARLHLLDGTRAVSTLMGVRAETPDDEKRRALLVRALDISRKVLQDVKGVGRLEVAIP